MPLVSEADVFKAVYTRFGLTSAAVAALTGGLHFERKPTDKTFPYAVVGVAGAGWEEDSGPKPMQTFAVTLTAWTASGGTVPSDLVEVLASVMRGVVLSDLDNATALIRVWPQPGAFSLADELRQGNDVLAASARWMVKVEATNANG